MKRFALAVAAAILAAPALSLAQTTSTWKVDDAHTHSSFTIRHMVISNVRGEFGKTSGTLTLDEKDLTKSSVEATIDVASIDTRVADRDAHLRSPDFFDAAKYPTITFKSTRVEKAGEGKLKVTGDLTMRGVTKPVVLEVTGPTAEVKDPWGNVRRGFAASGKLDRREWGLTWNKAIEAGPVVGDEVKLEIEGELIKAVAGKTAAK
jgi:polyisoprenoid-binding protein YceI